MTKLIFFWVILIQFIISFLITILAMIGYVTIHDEYLKKLVAVLILSQAAAVIALYKKTDFFDTSKEVNEEGWDLLATLWKFQKRYFPNGASGRWFLAINPISPDFTDFAIGYSRLRHLSMIDINSQNQISLSTTGYQYCEQNQKKLTKRKRLFYIE